MEEGGIESNAPVSIVSQRRKSLAEVGEGEIWKEQLKQWPHFAFSCRGKHHDQKQFMENQRQELKTGI